MSDLQPGPCASCGLRNYPLSFGGPTICPACDCGDSGPSRMNAQRARIAELERSLSEVTQERNAEKMRRMKAEQHADLMTHAQALETVRADKIGDYAEKLAALVDRALTMMMAAGYKVSPHDPDHNNPLVAWMADARAALRTENKAVPTRAKPPCPGCESLCLECPQHDEAAQSVPAIFHDLRVRIWNRIAPDTISIRFQRPITDAEAERFSRAFVALLTPEPGAARALVNEQAEDEGLWFEAVHASEAHLQRALRDLHAAVERECPSQGNVMEPRPESERVWRHKKTGGRYTLLAFGKMESDLSPVVIYYGEHDDVWVRPHAQFFDGRFEKVPSQGNTNG